MSIDPAAEYHSYRGQLWVEGDAIHWQVLAGGCEARLPIGGTPEDAEAWVTIKLGLRTSLEGSVLVLWRGERVANLDLGGPAHKDAVTGRSVPTPHHQWIDQLGRARAVHVDTVKDGIGGLEDALRWLLRQSDIEGYPAWREPPVQGTFLGSLPPKPRQRRRT